MIIASNKFYLIFRGINIAHSMNYRRHVTLILKLLIFEDRNYDQMLKPQSLRKDLHRSLESTSIYMKPWPFQKPKLDLLCTICRILTFNSFNLFYKELFVLKAKLPFSRAPDIFMLLKI